MNKTISIPQWPTKELLPGFRKAWAKIDFESLNRIDELKEEIAILEKKVETLRIS